MKYYRLKKQLLNISAGEVFTEEQIPTMFLYGGFDASITKEVGKQGEEIMSYSLFDFEINTSVWEKITEEEYKKETEFSEFKFSEGALEYCDEKHRITFEKESQEEYACPHHSNNECKETIHRFGGICYGSVEEEIDMETIEDDVEIELMGSDIIFDEEAVKAFLILKELTRELNDGWEPDWEDGIRVWIITYTEDNKKLHPIGLRSKHCAKTFIFYFKDEETAERALELGEIYFKQFYGIE